MGTVGSEGLIELSGCGRTLRQSDLIRLIDVPAIAPLPSSGSAWVGLANLRGEVIPVADLGILSGDGPTTDPVLAALRTGTHRFGLLIEGVERTVTAPPAGEPVDRARPEDPPWLLPSPPGRPRLIDPEILLEDPLLGGVTR